MLHRDIEDIKLFDCNVHDTLLQPTEALIHKLTRYSGIGKKMLKQLEMDMKSKLETTG